MSALVEAIRGGRLKDAVTLIAGGADVNEVAYGHSPLMHAVTLAKPKFVDLLLRNGADWRKQDPEFNFTPLMRASINSHVSPWRHFTPQQVRASRQIVEILVAAGATDPDTELVMGSVLNEAGMVASVHRLRPHRDTKVIEAFDSVVLQPPRMRQRLGSVVYDALLTIEELSRRRGLARVLEALAAVNPAEK